MKNILFVLLISVFCFQTPALAQQPVGGGETKSELTGTRKQLATIIFSGLAGAILGLSTLSFHGRPQDHLSNIAVGFAIGTIAGTVYTTYKAANAPRQYYDYSTPGYGFNQIEYKGKNEPSFTLASYQWEF